MQNSNTVFKTLRNIDGKDYVELSEILELFKGLADMPNFFGGVAQTLQRIERDLDKTRKNLGV